MELQNFSYIIPNEAGSFASLTVNSRFPKVLNDILTNHSMSESIRKRITECRDNLLELVAGDLDLTEEEMPYWSEFISRYRGMRLIDMPFFYCEIYFYRYILFLIEYTTYKRDPFAALKKEEFKRNRSFFVNTLELIEHNDLSLTDAIQISLAGNKADLSQLTGVYGEAHELIVNESNELIEAISNSTKIHLIADNAATELFSDVVLVDTILTKFSSCELHLHLKERPVLVSDATMDDWKILLESMETLGGKKLVQRLNGYQKDKRLHVLTHPAWNAPIHFTKVLKTDFELIDFHKNNLIISKGDANYRRFFEDRHLPTASKIEDLHLPISIPSFALRTLKSEIMVGLNTSEETKLNEKKPDWMTDGTHAIIQKII